VDIVQLTFKRDLKEQIHEAKFDKCYFCGKEEPKGKLNWFCGGNLFSSNPLAHPECYLNGLRKLGFNDKGYRKISNDIIEIFSQTTGWETINLKEVKMETMKGITLTDSIFSHVVLIYDKNDKHLDTFGITQETAIFLEKNGAKLIEEFK